MCGQPRKATTKASHPRGERGGRAAEQLPYPEDMYWSKGVPAATYPDFQLAELAVDGAIAGVAFLLTFPVVARRRPS